MNLRKLFSGIVAFVVVFLATSATSQRQGADAPLNVGDRLPEMGSLAQVRASLGATKYTLVHFWAAYDGQSRADNVRWSQLLQGIGRNDIAYRGVSLDVSKAVFEQTLRVDGLACDRQEQVKADERTQVLARCGVETRFHAYLLDQEGTIVAVDPTSDVLAKVH